MASCRRQLLVLLVLMALLICAFAKKDDDDKEKKKKGKCGEPPRGPPIPCCPDKYRHVCCPNVKPCNERNTTKPAPPPVTMPPPTNSSNGTLPVVPTSPMMKAPPACIHPWNTTQLLACNGGFYFDGRNIQACPEGFYCPSDGYCIIPCPKGAYCVQNELVQQKGGPSTCDQLGKCCMPARDPPIISGNKHICGGMSKPTECEAGYFCPNVTTKKICPEDNYCRSGSVEPDPCPFLTSCGEGETAPTSSYSGPLFDLGLLLIIILIIVCFNRRRTIKFYFGLYRDRIVQRDRSYSTAFNLDAGLRGVVVNMGDLEAKKEKIIPKDFHIDIAFNDLSLTLKGGNKKIVLQGVTGELKSGQVTAVMGPSGAGKTTFLNTLSGKAYYGVCGGKISINGEETHGIETYRTITGFVPQEDIMHRSLTVKEVLMYQSELRLPSHKTKREREELVLQVLDLLEIDHIKDSQIGDEETRGISGGQRKRVNIGMELVTDPTLIFLDEPTSGLDSTSSLSVLNALKAVAEKGRLNVVCVIHQPRFEIFSMFHNLLLLGPGGRTVYEGSVQGATQYFHEMGFDVPPNINPADYYMDVIGGVVKKEGIEMKDLFTNWDIHSEQHHLHTNDAAGANGDVEERPGVYVARKMPNPFQQLWTFLRREFKLMFRQTKTLLIDQILVLLAGGVLGALYSEVELLKFNSMNTMSALAIGLTAMLSALRCFGNHRTTFWRESASGVNRLSYFLAVNIAQLPIIVITPLIYLSLQYPLTSPRGFFKYHYMIVLCVEFCCTGIGYAVSTIFNPKNSQMASVVVVLISSMLGGSSPTLCKLSDYTVIGPFAYSISYARWMVEALFEKEAVRYPDVLRPLIDRIAYSNDYSLDNYATCCGALIGFGLLYRLFAFLFLVFTNRGKQQ